MVNSVYEIRYCKQAQKDIKCLKEANLAKNAKNLIEIIRENPYESPPPFEKLKGELTGVFSRRINRQHKIIYKVDKERKAVIIIRMWTHYE